jgi:MOSC domain-containing protein YiiM
MFDGELVAICIAPDPGDPLRLVEQVEAVPGKGIVGDRYFLERGTYSRKPGPDREVTLIEMEAIEALARDCGIAVEPAQARRNLVTRGIPLNHLIAREFTIGPVRLRGLRLCEPCGHLEKLTLKGIENGLLHRGGLRAQIIAGGLLRPGDPIRPVTAASRHPVP